MRKQKSRLKAFVGIITLRWLLALPVLFYRHCMSPLMPNVCPYHPSCSVYMLDSIHRHGAFKGVGMGVARLFRCMPWSKGGYDPVPTKKSALRWLV